MDDQFGKYVERLQMTPSQLHSLVPRLSQQQLRAKPSDGARSLMERLIHLRNLEVQCYLPSLRLVLLEETPELENLNRFAGSSDDQSVDAEKVLEHFCQAREGSLAYLRNMTAPQWHRRAKLAGEEVTLLSLVSKWADAEEGQMEEIEQLASQVKS